ncbi:MAG: hypothetical protein AB1609_16245 [Bacillota bacterium]
MDLWRGPGLEGRRALIVHHDDLGMTEVHNRACRQLGLPTGGSAFCSASETGQH